MPLAAAKLIAAAQASWVFAGMGSWNDLGFDGDDQNRYETISDNPFRIINSALVASANLSFASTQGEMVEVLGIMPAPPVRRTLRDKAVRGAGWQDVCLSRSREALIYSSPRRKPGSSALVFLVSRFRGNDVFAFDQRFPR